jgi:hypothetical protein
MLIERIKHERDEVKASLEEELKVASEVQQVRPL